MTIPGVKEVDDPDSGEFSEPGMISRLPDTDVILHLLKDRAGHHGIPGKRLFGDPVEDRAFPLREPRGPCLEHRRDCRTNRGFSIIVGDLPATIRLRSHDRCPDQIDPDPNILFVGSDTDDTLKDDLQYHPRRRYQKR